MIGRRQLLVSGAGMASGMLAGRHRKAHAATQALRIGYILPVASQLGAGATVFAQEVAKRTNGRIVIQQYPDATLGGDVELMKGIQLSSIDLAFVTGMGLSSVLPAAGVLNIPFLFKNNTQAHAVLDGPIGESFRKQFIEMNIVMLAWGENGLRHVTNARRPIVTPADLQGLRLRVPQSDVLLEGFKALGADAAPLPFPQLFEALRAGTFDGQENPIATIVAAKFDQVQKFLTLSGHAYDPAVFLMAPDAFDDLSHDDRTSFVEAAKLGGATSRSFAAKAETEGVAALQRAGMTVQASIDRDSFVSALAVANAGYEKTFGLDLIQQIRQTA
ncbi:MAG: DctP family TRAP transporter solute-binding subunit [Acetobacteraceae bacterium]|jgi:tripartite ATP-independent transporter DctP family solute receptor